MRFAIFALMFLLGTPHVFALGIGVSPSQASGICKVDQECRLFFRVFNPNEESIFVNFALDKYRNWSNAEEFEVPPISSSAHTLIIVPKASGKIKDLLIIKTNGKNIEAGAAIVVELDVKAGRKGSIGILVGALTLLIGIGVSYSIRWFYKKTVSHV